ncbi:hypothetical protein [Streptomyces sp. AGS-58]|uniref:hypothetical protein n=1 Tax=unclassified Streptomyces TaxID=2593676 RepID=UPI0035A2BB9F
MSSDANCKKLREYGAELALGVLSGRERAEAFAHLDRCADCREYIEHLTLVGDGLIGLLPDREPPLGFETRVGRALIRDAAAQEPRPPARASGRLPTGWRGRGHRARLRLASIGAAAAVACGLAGWGISTAVQEVTASPPAASVSEPMLVGDLTSAADRGQPVGEVYAHPGTSGWLFVSVDLDGRGTRYSGRVTCLLEHADGTTVRVGDFAVRDGRGDWGAPAAVDTAAVSGARLTSSDGTVIATSRLQVGHVQTPVD